MTKLSPQEREVVILAGRDGLTWKTVALTMGLHLSTVRVYVQRIIKKSGINREPRQAMVLLYLRGMDTDNTMDTK
ncbi:hypothetical protein LCGC14_1424740 [marine sediment metagenome]|uniref:RNA polymerase sigma factor 70 region 4 type 2 domain-containing protein n=1 Tax=marine sediment metagenome TaxID=412755 RepID=A0A0F9JQS5_9ZZZZ